jgi:hypothetical protein
MDDMHAHSATYLGDDDGRVGGGLIAWILGAIVVEFVGLIALAAYLL